MPSDQLPYLIDSKLKVEQHWRWDGTHYQKTSLAWLAELDGTRDTLSRFLQKLMGTMQKSGGNDGDFSFLPLQSYSDSTRGRNGG